MKNDNIHRKSDMMPIGVGYLRLIFDKQGKPEDCIFIEINSSFERFTGWQKEDVLEKRVSEVPGNETLGGAYWLTYLESVLRSGKTQETTQWIDWLKRYTRITVVPVDNTTCVLLLQDVSSTLNWQEQIESQKLLPEEFDVFFNKTHDAISLVEYVNGEFRYMLNNVVHQSLTGFNDIKGLTPVQLAGEEIGEKLRGYYEECMHSSRPVSYEQKFSFAPAKCVFQTEVSPVFGKNGIRYLLCSSKDISEQKKIQEEKEVLGKRLQSMFDQHDAVMMIIDPISGRIVDANSAACDFYGYSKAELLNLFIRDINKLPPDEVDKYRLVAYGEKQRFFTFPHRLKNGDIRIVDVYSCPITDGDFTMLYSIIFDVTERETYREELYLEKEMLLTTLMSIGDGVVTTDAAGVVTSLNPVAQDLTGWKNKEAKGILFTDVFHLYNEETGATVENPIQKVLDTGKIIGLANHTELVNRNGQCIPIADSAAPIKTEDGHIIGTVMVFRDVSDEKKHERHIEYLSYHDALTGLYNRRYFEKALCEFDTIENLPICIAMGDVNGLKLTNDVFGHKVGDTLLQEMAKRLRENSKGGDVVARWGGDEFVILMPRTNVESAEKLLRGVKTANININGIDLQLSISLGCASKNNIDEDIQAVISEAEEYMYHRKLLDCKSYRNSIINTLLVALYEKSNETEEHSKRLEKHCHSIAQKLQLSSKDMDELSLLALLHDLGKVSVDPNILGKRGTLTSLEWEEIRRHPEIGYRIAHATPELAIVAELILSHHERWDGKGYPRGLKGEDIPLACRIIAVTDAYDAMTNDRVYRSSISSEDAICELERNAGTQFDPAIVSIFAQVLHFDKNLQ